MKVMHFDCTNGISGDMVLKALTMLGDCEAEVGDAMKKAGFSEDDRNHGRSYHDVRNIIEDSDFTQNAKEYAKAMYCIIAEAEAEVHEATLDTIHFHEVGRDQAIKNALGIGMALDLISPDRITTSQINDGKGTIICSHGEIPVPVPAVRAIMKRSTFTFHQTDVETEMVTPSGLASLMATGAEPEDTDITQKNILKFVEACGARNTGRGGLKVYIYKE